jgi:hypothetical protein
MSEAKENKYADYVPKIMVYDPQIDGSDEHLIRDDHLAEKARLMEVISKLKKQQRGPDKTRR